MIIRLFLFLILVLIGSCGDEDSQKSVIKIQTPTRSDYVTSSPGGENLRALLEQRGWSQDAFPEDIFDFDCYGVFVKYEDPLAPLPSNFCYNPEGTLIGEPTDMFGLTPAGEEIYISIPSGPERTFQIVGFKIDTAIGGYCPFIFDINDEEEAFLSYPFIIGETTVSVFPGIQEVPVQMVFDYDKVIDKCEGPLFDWVPGDGTGDTFIEIEPYLVDLGTVGVAEESAEISFVLENNKPVDIEGCGVPELRGDDPSSYEIIEHTCDKGKLAPGESCTVTVQGIPHETGDKSAYVGMYCGTYFFETDPYGMNMAADNSAFQITSGSVSQSGGNVIVQSDIFASISNSTMYIGGDLCSSTTISGTNLDCSYSGLSNTGNVDVWLELDGEWYTLKDFIDVQP